MKLQPNHRHDHWPVWVNRSNDEWVYRCWCGHEVLEKPHRVSGKTGVVHNEHMQAIRDGLGRPEEDPFEALRIMEKHNRDNPSLTLRERQNVGIGVPVRKSSIIVPELNGREIEYLLDKLRGVNHPTGESAYHKLTAILAVEKFS